VSVGHGDQLQEKHGARVDVAAVFNWQALRLRHPDQRTFVTFGRK
jgi:hypothetical protein